MDELLPGGQPQARVIDCTVQMLSAADELLFQWQSWDHISILDSNQDLTADFIRYIHCNSVQETPDGNILLSNRNLDEVTKIDRLSGDILWRLGGVSNQFLILNDSGSSFQHDARQLENGHLTLFDNRTNDDHSRAVEYGLDETNLIATRVWQFRNQPDTRGPFMGSTARLANDNSLIGWGLSNQPLLTEVAPDELVTTVERQGYETVYRCDRALEDEGMTCIRVRPVLAGGEPAPASNIVFSQGHPTYLPLLVTP